MKKLSGFNHRYNIGDIVCMLDTFHFNPADKCLSIGTVQAVHIQQRKGKITYTISGFSVSPNESELTLLTTVQ